jgi:hypothetical protein
VSFRVRQRFDNKPVAEATQAGREFGSASVSKELQQLLQDLQNKIIKLDLDIRRFPEQNDTKQHWICLVSVTSMLWFIGHIDSFDLIYILMLDR